MPPRRFLVLSALAAFAILSTLLFLNRGDGVLTSPVNIPNEWTETLEDKWEQTWSGGKHDKSSGQLNEAIKNDDLPDTPAGFVQDDGVVPGENPVAAVTSSAPSWHPSPFPPPDTPLPNKVNVAVVESGGTNDEATAGLIHAFGKQPQSHLSLYTLQQRYGIDEIIKSFTLSHPLAANKSSSDFAEDVALEMTPDIVVSATCETDLITLDVPLTKLLAQKKTYLFCIIHQPERWAGDDLTRRIRPWIDQQLVDLVTTSQHTAHHLRTEVINYWDFNATITVRHLTPLFPVSLPDDEFPVAKKTAKEPTPALQYPIAVHGDFDATRHNYTDVFENVLSLREKAKAVQVVAKDGDNKQRRDISLHILGERVPPEVPKKVKMLLSLDHELTFQQQYETLSKSYIMLPAFADDAQSDYYSRLASWSIPAAMIAGVPVVASDALLQAYSYLPKEAAWPRYGMENEMKVAERVALWSVEEHRRKRKFVQQVTKELIKRNTQFVDEWVRIGMRRIERQGWRTGVATTSEEEDSVPVMSLPGDD